jgi:hypothetical protein
VKIPDRDSTEYARALRDAQLRHIARARQDAGACYEYVMREETSRERLKLLPHQRLCFDFVQAHKMCIVRLPVGGSKTYMMGSYTMSKLGEDPTARGAIISSTAGQAAKPVRLVRDYIEQSYELRAVYPNLRPSQREGDPWTQFAITVDRPFGIRDPSLVAVGVDGNLPGSRLSWINVDDILSMENTNTLDGRQHVFRWFGSTVLSRRDLNNSRIVVTNTPWVAPTSSDPGDLTYQLENQLHWPTLTINVYGEVTITNAPEFDTPWVRPAVECTGPDGAHRLTEHDKPEYLAMVYGEEPAKAMTHDADERVSYWPAKFTNEEIARVQEETPARDFASNYEMRARAQTEDREGFEGWVLNAKAEARRLGYYGFLPSINALRLHAREVEQHAEIDPSVARIISPDMIVTTGVDLGIGKKKSNALTVMFTIVVLPPDNRRLPIDIEAGHWSGRDIVLKLIAKHEAYGSIIRVENNAAQDFIRQWANDADKSVPVKAHCTGANKANPIHGVESLFIEIEQGGWLMPCSQGGKSPVHLEAWLQTLRQYTPEAHTGDYLMAAWFADIQAKKQGAFLKGQRAGALGSIGALHGR